jgi:hypothetical protein
MPQSATSSAASAVLEHSGSPTSSRSSGVKKLSSASASIYLGVECNDGLEAMERRMGNDRKFPDRFGVSHYCGYAFNTEILPQLLSDLRKGADEHAAAMGAR